MTTQKILVTGAAGFIGSHLCERLLQLGYKVFAIDNLLTGQISNLPQHQNLITKIGSIASEAFLESCFFDFRPDVVVHAAASFKDPIAWKEDVENNVMGTIEVVKACLKYNINKLIYFQTSLCYGLNVSTRPIPIDFPVLQGNEQGLSSYAISKTAAEQYIAMSGISFVSFRLANIYGPRNITGPIPAFYKKISQNELVKITNTRRDLVFVTDLIDCVQLAIEGKGGSGYYHISTGEDVSIKSVFNMVTEALGVSYNNFEEIERGKDDTETILIDPSVTISDFGWRARTSLKEGIEKTISWYHKNPFEKTYTHLRNL